MTKQDIKRIFGSYAECGRVIGLSRQAICLWPDPVPLCHADRVMGACVRKGMAIPADVLAKVSA